MDFKSEETFPVTFRGSNAIQSKHKLSKLCLKVKLLNVLKAQRIIDRNIKIFS